MNGDVHTQNTKTTGQRDARVYRSAIAMYIPLTVVTGQNIPM